MSLSGADNCVITTGGWRYTSPSSTNAQASAHDCGTACSSDSSCTYWSYDGTNCNLIDASALDPWSGTLESGITHRGTKYCQPPAPVVYTIPEPPNWAECSAVPSTSGTAEIYLGYYYYKTTDQDFNAPYDHSQCPTDSELAPLYNEDDYLTFKHFLSKSTYWMQVLKA